MARKNHITNLTEMHDAVRSHARHAGMAMQ